MDQAQGSGHPEIPALQAFGRTRSVIGSTCPDSGDHAVSRALPLHCLPLHYLDVDEVIEWKTQAFVTAQTNDT